MTPRGTPAALLAAAVGVASLVGCSNGDAPPQTLPPISSTRSTPSPTPTNSAEALKQSAEQFVRDYFDEYQRAQRTNDYSRLQNMYYADSCQPCAFDIRVLAEDKREGRHVEGYEIVLKKVVATAPQQGSAAVDVVLHNRAGRLVKSDGTLVKRLNATKPVATAVYLARRGNTWMIYNIRSFGEVEG